MDEKHVVVTYASAEVEEVVMKGGLELFNTTETTTTTTTTFSNNNDAESAMTETEWRFRFGEVVGYMSKVGVMTVGVGVATCAAGKYLGGLPSTSRERVDATLPFGLLLSLSGMSLFQKAPWFSGAMVAVGALAIAVAFVTTKATMPPLSHADATVIVLLTAVVHCLF